ncbi:hypothetical protein PC114_g24505 [Phytophthora cactorum]|uniref:Apple domain-containing protein n=1 Tax=Phytophthora cactorum TaxID=29920 RepID=A0A8T1B2Y5_9STRA|nr:hypothetical protein PC114_g24505 [Phytophthora cactorum]KAG2895291.1 hypothetical protein PC115_g17889 [Phytophthora cactorum]
MAGRKLATAAGFAGIITAGLVSADVPIVVYHDATYSLPEAYGVPCSGVGAEPEGTACPKAGHVATSDCQPYLVSYNGAVCVAPVDAECVLGHDDVWGCEFPKTGYSSAVEAETIVAYVGETLGWGTGYKKNHGTTEDNADKTEDQQTSENHDTEGQPYDETTQTRKMAEVSEENLQTVDGRELEYTTNTHETGTVKPCDQNKPPTESTTFAPTDETTDAPTQDPYAQTDAPTESTTFAPTDETTDAPTQDPYAQTDAPTESTTFAPTDETTDAPTQDPYAQTDAPTESTTFAPTDETTDAPTQDPYAQTDAPTESTTFAPTDDPTDAPTDGPTDAPTEPPTPCDNQGINGIGVENKVRYNNADIYSTTPGPRNSQSWHSCCRSCYNDLNCYAFSFQQTSSDSVCELTTSTSGREEDQQNWQAGNMGRAS